MLEIKISPASGTATIAFPTEALASEALDKIHGVVLETLPLLVVRALNIVWLYSRDKRLI